MTAADDVGAASATSRRRALEVLDLGRVSYERAHALQRERLDARIRGAVPDALLIVEHDPVVTRGRRSPVGDTDDVRVPVVTVERGGEATYHGPGQVVVYPILELPEGRRDLHRYLRDLERVVIDALAELGVEGHGEEGLTGVWIGPSKVCSIGVAVRRWVTWHGLALNVTTDLEPFHSFRPCGLRPDLMTRVADHVRGDVDPDALVARARDAVVRAFRERFEFA